VLVAPTHYAALGLEPDASAADVKRAFHRLALKLHPEKNKQELAEEGFKRAQQAHATLADPTLRRDYDLSLGLRPRRTASSRRHGY